MTKSLPKRRALLACLLLLLVLLVPVLLTWRAWRQAQLDHALIAHIQANDADAVIVDLRQGADANVQYTANTPPTFLQLLRNILPQNRVAGKKGKTPLLVALIPDNANGPVFDGAGKGQEELVEALLEAGANPNSTGKFGETPLIVAALYANLSSLRHLVAHGARVNARSFNGETALTETANLGDVEMTNFLLEQGADTNVQTTDGYTPLMRATLANSIEIVQKLLTLHADPNFQNSRQQSALRLASGSHGATIRKLLRQAGAKQ